MARTATEVLIGPGTFYLAPTGTAFPADPSAAPAGTWADIGYSEEGWAFNAERTVEDIDVAEELDPIDVMQTKRLLHVVGIAVQGSLENLKLAMGGGTIVTAAGPPALKTYTPPASASDLDRKAGLLRIKAPGTNKLRDVQMPYLISVGALQMEAKKAPAKTQLALDFRIIKTQPSDLPFTVVDLT